MRSALLSDIHANLPALEAVFADLDVRSDIDAIYHLGDLVGHAPWPDEVVQLLKDRAIPGIAGNYDSTTGTDYRHCGCRYEDARQEELSHVSYEWTRAHVSAGNEAVPRLAAVPHRRTAARRLRRRAAADPAARQSGVEHGLLDEDRPDRFFLEMAGTVGAKAGGVIAFGHTHEPWHREIDGIHFVNTGSVGRPKDGDPRAGYALVSIDGMTVGVEFVRFAYDIERATRGIRDSELPDDFAEILRTGGKAPAETGGEAG